MFPPPRLFGPCWTKVPGHEKFLLVVARNDFSGELDHGLCPRNPRRLTASQREINLRGQTVNLIHGSAKIISWLEGCGSSRAKLMEDETGSRERRMNHSP